MTETMTPREIVAELDRYIIGQNEAKRAVAIALRDRWRRMQLDDDLRPEVMPKNILMIGPTGVGKTEIARRLANLSGAPFIKVEATKFTEVGYVGREVDSIIRDLAEVAIKAARTKAKQEVRVRAEQMAEERLLDALLPRPRGHVGFANQPEPAPNTSEETRDKIRQQLRAGALDEREVDIEISAAQPNMEIMTPPGMEEMTGQLENMLRGAMGSRQEKRRVKVGEALKLLAEDEAGKLVNEEEVRRIAIREIEDNGIVFIDELDKVARRSGEGVGGADVSREGVQRDLLPLVEGSTVNTRYGMVRTDHILFIASGAFHLSKPSDLIPELQGRLPIRVELKALTSDDFVRILTEPRAALTIQYEALMATEGLQLRFTDDGVRRIAEVAFQVNEQTENIGARRLHTIMQRLLETVSYEAPDRAGHTVVVDAEYVDSHLGELVQDEDLSRFIL